MKTLLGTHLNKPVFLTFVRFNNNNLNPHLSVPLLRCVQGICIQDMTKLFKTIYTPVPSLHVPHPFYSFTHNDSTITQKTRWVFKTLPIQKAALRCQLKNLPLFTFMVLQQKRFRDTWQSFLKKEDTHAHKSL